ncbi:hypothetical protein AYI68_g4652 [Smittium mucronatum]|uniref:DUF4112 domain-containing protein n=1 Tax=Smittium mucronatum TaxID=133383 RepID=A0A1R0GWG5_9FUNG|nr:hypothetical protein AYI68_g4652 [Smittium mucronatum]
MAHPSNAKSTIHCGPNTEHPDSDKLTSLRDLAQTLDCRYTCCGVRFGTDSILGFIPVIGDFAGLFFSALFVAIAWRRFKVKKWAKLTMVLYILADFVVGLIPGLGDFADVLFKANQYNYAIVENCVLELG